MGLPSRRVGLFRWPGRGGLCGLYKIQQLLLLSRCSWSSAMWPVVVVTMRAAAAAASWLRRRCRCKGNLTWQGAIAWIRHGWNHITLNGDQI